MRQYEYNTVIVGTGASGWNAADSLLHLGQSDICVVTEDRNAGTSRNTGSDKQTYYKLTLSGGEGDSVREMAETLFEGGCVDGDLALCEAALSAKCFFKLVDLGVPFPKNRYGEYIGYKTDHDPRRRATSAGPYTSKIMTECLEKSVLKRQIPIFDAYQVIKILVKKGRVYGILCLDLNELKKGNIEFAEFFCKNLIYAVGGPAGIYADSVYPKGHYGATGIALEAGVWGKNVTEWQYGIASVNPRWNVSGTYMQALPRVYSVSETGEDEKEFLTEAFTNHGEMLTNLFLKGYQWPFDVRKALQGSSRIDLLVYRETLKGRKVFLDYTKNPMGKTELNYNEIGEEARQYLKQAGACFGTPIERLRHMNAPAVAFYKDHGIDLEKEPLEIALCAQHNNGGLSVNTWWQTNVAGFFAVGEVSATHGIHRPGGSALNAGQVGAFRAAEYITERERGRLSDTISLKELETMFSKEVHDMKIMAYHALELGKNKETLHKEDQYKEDYHKENHYKEDPYKEVGEFWDTAARRMSEVAAAVRDSQLLQKTAEILKYELEEFSNIVYVKKEEDIWKLFRMRDVLISQYVYICAMEDYKKHGGKSRGSALYTDDSGEKPMEDMPEKFRFVLDEGELSSQIQEVLYQREKKTCAFQWRTVRKIPEEDDFFENVWRQYRKNHNVDADDTLRFN